MCCPADELTGVDPDRRRERSRRPWAASTRHACWMTDGTPARPAADLMLSAFGLDELHGLVRDRYYPKWCAAADPVGLLTSNPGELLVAARVVDVDHSCLDISVPIGIQTWRSAIATPGPVLPVELFDNEAGRRLLAALARGPEVTNLVTGLDHEVADLLLQPCVVLAPIAGPSTR